MAKLGGDDGSKINRWGRRFHLGFSSWGSSWVVGRFLWLLVLIVVGVSVNKLNADLLGEGEFDLLASWGSQLGDALLNRFGGVFNLWDGDALVLGDLFAADTWEKDWLVDAGLDWFWVRDGHINIDWGNNGDIVFGGLGNFVAVLVSVAAVSVAAISTMAVTGWSTDSDHLDIALLLKGDFNGLGGGAFFLLLVAVRADFVGDGLDSLSADGPDNIIAEFLVNNLLDGQVNVLTHGLEGWSAHFGDLGHILNGAVVLWLFISVVGLLVAAISWGGVVVSGWLVVGWSRLVVWGWLVVGWGMAVGLGWDG